ncbi:MAG: hypothetical protein QNK89_11400 [Lacinutrix sp.]|uniref:hypothetical protein n=1 Tax=Lacinutrix sp. TaxID=1937692 RepID=UPI0030A3DD4A
MNGYDKNNSPNVKKYKQHALLLKGEKIATLINNNIGDLRTFNNQVLKYFSDCKSVASYIEGELYQDYDIVQITDDYNTLCE